MKLVKMLIYKKDQENLDLLAEVKFQKEVYNLIKYYLNYLFIKIINNNKIYKLIYI